MDVIYEGVNIYPEISVSHCIHEMYTEGKADSVEIRLNDTRFLWDGWDPKEGDTLVVSEESATTGLMWVTSAKPENGLFTLRASSVPKTAIQSKVDKAWENIHFLQLAGDIAGKYGLSLETHGVEDVFYPYLRQQNTADMVFLQEQALFESASVLVFDGKLVLYNEPFVEGGTPAGTLTIEAKRDFQYSDESGQNYSECLLQSGVYKGSFTDPTATEEKTLYPKRNIYVTSDGEATRYAKGILRFANKKNRHGVLYQPFLPEYSAGSTVNLETTGYLSWDGPVFITRLRHDYVKKASKVFFRRLLEGGY